MRKKPVVGLSADGSPRLPSRSSLFVLLAPWLLLTPLALHAADTDIDGLPDDWEVANFGNLTTASATTDFDGDGTFDISEFLAGTSPVNPADNFRAAISRNGAQLHTAVTEHVASGTGYAGLTRVYDWLSSSRVHR